MKKTVSMICFFMIILVANGADNWPDYADRPEWIKRGSARISFEGWDFNQQNLVNLGINLFRIHYLGLTLSDYKRQEVADILKYYLDNGVATINYTSPTDCFWDGRLRNLIPHVADWRVDILENQPYLVDGLLYEGKDRPFIAYNNPNDRGGNAARKAGCRLSKVWNTYTMDMYLYLMKGKKAIEGKAGYDKWPDYSPIEELVQGFYIDNAQPFINCVCPECQSDWQEYIQKSRKDKIPDSVARSKYRAEVCYRYNKSITDLNNKFNRYTMFGGQLAFLDTEVNANLWERLYQHPPWGRLYAYYKTGLSLSNGQLNSAITYLAPPPDLGVNELPSITPHFTQIALAEGFANIGSYILFFESSGDFYKAVKRYNDFNIINQELYSNSQRNGKVAFFFSIQTMLLGRHNFYQLSKECVEQLASAGIPVEVISERDLGRDWMNTYDAIIVRNLSCVSSETVEKFYDFHKNGGKILLTNDFAQYDELGRKNSNPQAEQLIKMATDKGKNIRLMDYEKLEEPMRYPPNFKSPQPIKEKNYYLTKLDEVFAEQYPVTFRAPNNPNADWMINAQKNDDLKIDSFHIVNYSYKTNPILSLNSNTQSILLNFTCPETQSEPLQFNLYGKSVNGGCGLKFVLNGEDIVFMSAEEVNKVGEHEGFPVVQPRWLTISMPKDKLKPFNQLEIIPEKKSAEEQGEFIIYIDPWGSIPSFYRDSKINKEWSSDLSPDVEGLQRGSYVVQLGTKKADMPLFSTPNAIENGQLTLPERQGEWYAALITPDGKSKLLTIERGNQLFNISLPNIEIYSVILMGQDKTLLENLVQKNNESFEF